MDIVLRAAVAYVFIIFVLRRDQTTSGLHHGLYTPGTRLCHTWAQASPPDRAVARVALRPAISILVGKAGTNGRSRDLHSPFTAAR